MANARTGLRSAHMMWYKCSYAAWLDTDRAELAMNHPVAIRARVKTSKAITAVVLIVLVVVLGYGFLSQARPEGRAAPDFTLQLFGGGEITLRQQRGQVVVLNFWASWCEPCREEAPALEATWRRYQGSGVFFIGIDVDDVDKSALAFMEHYGVTYPNGPDRLGRIAKAYRTTGQPETFIIAGDGTVVSRHLGAMSQDELQGLIEEQLQR